MKDWDIKINYGIKTGCNEAFIIDGAKRKELIEASPNSAEIIRPILRGKDIKRYTYNFADKYLITTFPSKKYNIDDYPSVKEYLLNFGKTDTVHLSKYGKNCWGKKRLEQSGNKGSRKKTNNKWFELQDSIAYWEDFSKPKIMYSEIVQTPHMFLDYDGFFYPEATTFIITGKNLEYLYLLLQSNPILYFFKTFYSGGGLGEKGIRYKKEFLNNLPIPLFSKTSIQNEIISLSKDKSKINENQTFIDEKIYKLYDLTDTEIYIIEKNSF